jgi:hypothetical protein
MFVQKRGRHFKNESNINEAIMYLCVNSKIRKTATKMLPEGVTGKLNNGPTYEHHVT